MLNIKKNVSIRFSLLISSIVFGSTIALATTAEAVYSVQDEIVFDIGEGWVNDQGEAVVPVYVVNFQSALAFQFGIEWDNTLFQLDSVSNYTLDDLSPTSFYNTDSTLSVIWDDASLEGQSLPDSTILFQLHFSALSAIPEEVNFPLDFIADNPEPLFIEYLGGISFLEVIPVLAQGALINPLPMQVVDSILIIPQCNGENNGQIEVLLTGGIPPYTYTWNNGQMNSVLTGVSTGSYTVYIEDAINDTVMYQFFLDEPSSISLASVITLPSCEGGNNAEIEIVASGGTGDFDYLWSTDSIEASLSGITAGNYTVTVSDANDCDIDMMVTVSDGDPLEGSIEAVNASCFGLSDAALNVIVPDSLAPYTYIWNNGNTLSTLEGVSAGIEYEVVVNSHLGCTWEGAAMASEPSQMLIDAELMNPLCFDGNDGVITIDVTGGVMGYEFLWDNGDTISTLESLEAGSYSLTVSDQNDCMEMASFLLENPDPIALNFELEYGCGDGDVDVTASASAGAFPYQYDWGNQQFGATLQNLNAGTYQITITDANNCTIEDEVSVDFVPGFQLEREVSNITCHGDANGVIELFPMGAISPYLFEWSTGETSSTISGLEAGNYSFTVTSASGCNYSSNQNIIEPNPISLNITATPSDNDLWSALVFPVGGSPPFIANWSNGETGFVLEDVEAGVYNVDIIDGNGCSYQETVYLGVKNASKATHLIEDINIFPNPCKETLFIDLGDNIHLFHTVMINSIDGKNVLKDKLEIGGGIINCETLSPGVYFLFLSGHNVYSVKKFIKT